MDIGEQSGTAFDRNGSKHEGMGVDWGDYDNDGWLNVVLANGHIQDNTSVMNKNTTFLQRVQLFRNREGDQFDDVSGDLGFPTPILGRGLAIGDFDNDGRMDLLVVDSAGAPALLHNETAHAGHWIEVKLRGTRSNRDGIGALLTFVTPDHRSLLRRCATDGSYMSASDRRVHCGLGTSTSVLVSVQWPGAGAQLYPNIAADQIVTLTQSRQQ
ncbi:MAG TPA: CRTAC1 family protein [Chthonomonadales bacterium]|nr:CRTAC1 family protein [Chthonomonadales bacterium]